MTSLKVLIADDEQLARAAYAAAASARGRRGGGEAQDGDEVLSRLKEGGVDLVLLDVQMPKLTGTEALALWPADGPLVVFCTAHAEHAVRAFDTGAVDYLLGRVLQGELQSGLPRFGKQPARERTVGCGGFRHRGTCDDRQAAGGAAAIELQHAAHSGMTLCLLEVRLSAGRTLEGPEVALASGSLDPLAAVVRAAARWSPAPSFRASRITWGWATLCALQPA